jgi:hypothetical protein
MNPIVEIMARVECDAEMGPGAYDRMVETAKASDKYNVIQWQVDQYRKKYQAAYNAIIANGYVIVPKEPTHEMKSAGAFRMTEYDALTTFEMNIARSTYSAMIKASQ